MTTKALCWIRRDIRLHDHAALAAALENHDEVYLAFVFDNDILDPLKKRASSDKRVQFIAESLVEIQKTLEEHQSGLLIRYGNPVVEIPELVKTLGIHAVYFNRDYSTYPRKRDATVTETLSAMGCKVHTYKDHVMVEPHEVLTQNRKPYHVFTPYARAWRQAVESSGYACHNVVLRHLAPVQDSPAKTLARLLAFAGFADCEDTQLPKGGTTAGRLQLQRFASHIDRYDQIRDFPSLDQTSRLSVYIRHGCLSIREMMDLAWQSQARSGDLKGLRPFGPVSGKAGSTDSETHLSDKEATKGREKWLTELIWREFYQMIFYHYPEVNTEAFQPKFKGIRFPTNEDYLAKWKAGQTGFPIIDAAMRCLNETGWMHNRLRMVVASFLSKTLLVDWKRGERYFSWKLLDYELASNNGGWQWAVGIGCDAAPYFRIFNPTLQSQKYDPEGTFIKHYCPELRALSPKQIHNPSEAKGLPVSFRLGVDYPRPIVDYKIQRQKALALYKNHETSTL